MSEHPWMSTTVAALMAKIDAELAYDLFPILCDALEDEGYPDASILASLRSGTLYLRGPWYRRVLTQEVTREEAKKSFDWLVKVVGDFRMNEEDAYDVANGGEVDRTQDPEKTVDWLLDVCKRCAADPESGHVDEDSWAVPGRHPPHLGSDDDAVRKTWEAYNALTGSPVPVEAVSDWLEPGHPDHRTYPRQLFRCGC